MLRSIRPNSRAFAVILKIGALPADDSSSVLMPAYDRINVRTTGNLFVFTHRKVSERNDYFGALIVDRCHRSFSRLTRT